MAALALMAGVSSARADGETMQLNFQCQIERGRPVLTSTTQQNAFKVVGPRNSHAFTACTPSDPNRCRTWQIHKFDFICAGQRVSWLTAAASLVERFPHRGSLDNGRLSLRLGPAWQRRDLVPVGFRHPYAQRDQLLAFPAGFAPSLGTGVKFSGSMLAAPTVIDAKPDVKPEAKVPKPEQRALSVGEVSPQPSKPKEAAISEGWAATVTHTVSEVATAAEETSQLLRGFVVLAVGLALVGLLVVVKWRSATVGDPPSVFPAETAAASSAVHAGDDAALCAELVSRAVNLHQTSREAVEAVPSANLREILSNDLAAVQRRLLSADLTADVADERWALVKPVVTKALGDLERIARIIAGVLSSQPRPEQAAAQQVAVAAVPETVSQAFEMLGVNPEATRTVVKKVVDGLRQSWHPDHARDAEDRARREERMKQINSAWDLIRASQDQRAPTEEAA